jgi:glycosyltransferase involved in cell wall biosynthesis
MTQSAAEGIHTPRVSIVMPMFNSAHYLKSTVDSVVHQTFAEWELILFDDGSTDGTATLAHDLAESDRRIKTATGRHQGVAVARNDGLRESDPDTEFVVFLDSDDTWTPEALETLVDALDSHPAAPAAHALARATDLDGRPYPDDDLAETMRNRRQWRDGVLVDIPITSPTPFAAMIVRNWVGTPGTSIIRRAALRSVGELDPATAPADDWDVNIRLSRLGDFIFVDRVVLNWRRHPDSLANTSKRWRRANFEVRKRSIRHSTNTAAQRAIAVDLLGQDCKAAASAALDAVRRRAFRPLAGELLFATLGLLHYLRFRLSRR